MTEYKTELVIDLTNPIEYHSKGQVEQSYQLILKAPCNRVKRQCYQLKQGYKRAVMGIAKDFASVASQKVEEEKESEDKQPTAADIVEYLQLSNIEYADYMDIFKSLITNKMATVVDDVYLNSIMFDTISMDDTDTMLGEYLANFLL